MSSDIGQLKQYHGIVAPSAVTVTSGGQIDVGPNDSVIYITAASALRLSTTPFLVSSPVQPGRLLRIVSQTTTITIPNTTSALSATGVRSIGGFDIILSANGSAEFVQQDDGSWVQVTPSALQGFDLFPLGMMADRNRHELFEPFKQCPIPNADVLITDTNPTLAQMALRLRANRDFEVIENSGATTVTNADVAFSARGGIRLTTKTTANDACVLRPHLDSNQTAWAASSAWLSQQSPRLEAQISLVAITACIARVGFFEDVAQPADLASVGSDDNAAFFIFDEDNTTSATNWVAVINVGGTDTAYDTGVAVAAATEYRLEIRVDSSRIPRFYINGVLVATGTALTTAVSHVPMVAIATDTAGAKSMDVRYIRASTAH